jgi:hypothetical protein
MYCLTKNNLAWIKIAKNACTSWQTALEADGWKLENLSDYQGRWHEKIWFGFLRDPDTRHTMGVVQFLYLVNLLSLLDDQKYSKIASALLYDEHTYSIHHLVPYELIQQTHWFVIDHKYFNYETLVRTFCSDYGITIPPIPVLHKSSEYIKACQSKLTHIKQQNKDIHAKLQRNYLELDNFLYDRASQVQSKYDKY